MLLAANHPLGVRPVVDEMESLLERAASPLAL